MNLQTIKEIRNYIAGELKDIYPENEVMSLFELVACYVLGINRPLLLLDPDRKITPGNSENITVIVSQLKTGKPIQYIMGETIFYGCRIRVNPGVLIPRQETEELADLILKENSGCKEKITDIGTGSGCIAVALAANLPLAKITATDISESALNTARQNAKLNNVKINFIVADIFSTEASEPGTTDIVVSNPPYVMESEKVLMHTNVLDYEPHTALFVPDNDPLVFYRAIFEWCRERLSPRGKIYLEINEAMGPQMRSLMSSFGYNGISVIRDINGKNRIIKGIKNG